jgi:hypothetical protein
MVAIEVQGSGIENVELLPATGYTPRLGVFTVSPDKTLARLNFDTTMVPNGLLRIRVSAFNAPAGQPGSEIIAMSVRTVTLQNDPPPFGSQEGRAARCQMMSFAYTDPADSLPVVCITQVPPSPPIPNDQCRDAGFGTGFGDPEGSLAVLRDGRLISKLYCEPRANNGVVNPGCICMAER